MMSDLSGEFVSIGRDLFLSGLVTSRSGNLSQKNTDGTLTITRSGSLLLRLTEKDLVCVSIANGANALGASSEVEVHRAILNRSQHKAVVHAHSPFTMALVNKYGVAFPDDEFLAKYGPPTIVGKDGTLIVGGFVDEIAAALSKHVVVVVRGHGVFAAGQDLVEAFAYITALEASSKLFYLHKSLPGGC